MSGTSSRGERLGGSGLVQLMRLAAKTNAVELALGTPGAPEPSAKLVTEAGYALLRGDHHQYADPIGHPQLRAAIAASLATPANPKTEITVTVGSTEGICTALLSVVDSGDEVVVFEPFYENFIKAIHLAGAVPRFVQLRQPGWHYDPAEFAAAFGPRTRALILNSPNNPTGRILTRPELEEIARVCDKWDVTVISDEVYSSYVYDGATFTSAADVPALSGRSIVVNSLSKSHAISGWRLGYLRAPAELTTIVRRVHEVTSSGAPAPLQLAVARAGVLSTATWRSAELMQRRRDTATHIFTDFGWDVLPAQGGVFLTANIMSEDSESFVRDLLHKTGVLVAPGKFFVSDGGNGDFVRIAFNRSEGVLDKAARRLAGSVVA